MAREIEIDEHTLIINEYGDGYHEPRSESIDCLCGAHIGDWMQYYAEAPSPEQDWLDHLAFAEHGIDPTPIYTELGEDYEVMYSGLNQALTNFGRIDCGIPGARRETLEVINE